MSFFYSKKTIYFLDICYYINKEETIYMENKKIFIDFDGVILDSEERIIKQKLSSNLDWDNFFQTVDWFQLLSTSKIINNSVNYILEKQKSYKNLAILTKIHTVNEMLAKTEYIRNKQIEIPIFLFHPAQPKAKYIFLKTVKFSLTIV